MTFRYIIAGDNDRAIAIHSDKNWNEMHDYVRQQSRFLHKDSHVRVFTMGVTELVNPKVMTPTDFVNYCPYLIP